jgi:integrase
LCLGIDKLYLQRSRKACDHLVLELEQVRQIILEAVGPDMGVRFGVDTSDGFRASWGKTCIKAGLADDLHFHDLRGSAVVRLALAGATVPQIATFTGHSLKDVETILDKHYLGRDVRLAEDAMRKLERKEKRTKTVK